MQSYSESWLGYFCLFRYLSRAYIKVHTATRWTIRHSLKLHWFADLMNVTEEVTIHRPNVSTLLSSAFIRGDLNAATRGLFIWYLLAAFFLNVGSMNCNFFFIKSANQSSFKLCLSCMLAFKRARNSRSRKQASEPLHFCNPPDILTKYLND